MCFGVLVPSFPINFGVEGKLVVVLFFKVKAACFLSFVS